ncbi:MAG: thioredoxin family protein, partial [Deltaproteobacteria bacterium]|nr:thioredoxin family protein [Deltaproteobacteria bacterium]
KKVMETIVRDYVLRPDQAVGENIGAEMVRRLSEKNYIPDRAKDLYAAAFVQELKKSLGQPVDIPVREGLRIAVLGPGCSQCDRLEMDVRDVLSEMNLPGELLHVTDIREISQYGVMGVPALVVNDKVVCVGNIPHKNKIREWLGKAQD